MSNSPLPLLFSELNRIKSKKEKLICWGKREVDYVCGIHHLNGNSIQNLTQLD